MAKIGTAHIEVKPVLNEEALAGIVQRIEDAVAEGVRRGLEAQRSATTLVVDIRGDQSIAAAVRESVERQQRAFG